MSHSLGSKGSSSAMNDVKRDSSTNGEKRSIVISVAKDSNSKTRSSHNRMAGLGLANCQIETALGTIAPKAVLTLPPVSGMMSHFNRDLGERESVNSAALPSVIPVKEQVLLGLPGFPGMDDELTIRRRKPVPMQQLIQNHVLRKPGLNISESAEESKFSALEYYGCREEPLDELLVTTFHLIVKIPVQAAADIIVDMPDWMRKKFLMRFKLPPLINEVLSARLDDYEQPEDDAVAVAAEVVWSNALAAGSMAEYAVTFFPPRLSAKSSLNRLRVEGASRKLKPTRGSEVAHWVDLSLPVVESGSQCSSRELGAGGDLEASAFLSQPSLSDGDNRCEFDEVQFQELTSSVWGEGVNLVSNTGNKIHNDVVNVDEKTSLELPAIASCSAIVIKESDKTNLVDKNLIAVDARNLLTEDVMVNAKIVFDSPRSEISLGISREDGVIGVFKEKSLTLPPPPIAGSIPDSKNANLAVGVSKSNAPVKDVSVVKLDNGNLVLL